MSDRAHMPVREVMTEDPLVVDGLASVQTAVEFMRERDVSSIVVDRRNADDEYGIVVVHDIAEHIVDRNASPDRTSVYQIMSKPVISVDADMEIKYAIRLLFKFGLSRALVLDDGDLIGIVTQRDLVLACLKPAAAE